jgi:hypothetical protein
MPVSEFDEHQWFWKHFRWGMTDDMLSIQTTMFAKKTNPSANIEPWMVKTWSTQKDYTWRCNRLIIKPVSAIRSGFMAVVNAIKGMSK